MTIDLGHTGASKSAARPLWRAIAILLATGLFLQAVSAGEMLSGEIWARAAHLTTATAVLAGSGLATLGAFVMLRRVPGGLRLGLLLLALTAGVFVQFALGKMTAKGANLLWAHIPLGVALVGLAMQTVRSAAGLGEMR
jgi:hypothetical protein